MFTSKEAQDGSVNLSILEYHFKLPDNWDNLSDESRAAFIESCNEDVYCDLDITPAEGKKRQTFENWLLIEIGKLLIRIAAGPFGPFIKFP